MRVSVQRGPCHQMLEEASRSLHYGELFLSFKLLLISLFRWLTLNASKSLMRLANKCPRSDATRSPMKFAPMWDFSSFLLIFCYGLTCCSGPWDEVLEEAFWEVLGGTSWKVPPGSRGEVLAGWEICFNEIGMRLRCILNLTWLLWHALYRFLTRSVGMSPGNIAPRKR